MPVTVSACLILAAVGLWLWRLRVERRLAAARARRRLDRIGRTAARADAAVALGRRPAPAVVPVADRRRRPPRAAAPPGGR